FKGTGFWGKSFKGQKIPGKPAIQWVPISHPRSAWLLGGYAAVSVVALGLVQLAHAAGFLPIGHAPYDVVVSALQIGSWVLGGLAALDVLSYLKTVWNDKRVTEEEFYRVLKEEADQGHIDPSALEIKPLGTPSSEPGGIIKPMNGVKRSYFLYGFANESGIFIRRGLVRDRLKLRRILNHEIIHFNQIQQGKNLSHPFLIQEPRALLGEALAYLRERGIKIKPLSFGAALRQVLKKAGASLDLPFSYETLIATGRDLSGSSMTEEIGDHLKVLQRLSGAQALNQYTVLHPEAAQIGHAVQRQLGKSSIPVHFVPSHVSALMENNANQKRFGLVYLQDFDWLFPSRDSSEKKIQQAMETFSYVLGRFQHRLLRRTMDVFLEGRLGKWMSFHQKRLWRKVYEKFNLSEIQEFQRLEGLYGLLRDRGMVVMPLPADSARAGLALRLLRFWQAGDGGRFDVYPVGTQSGVAEPFVLLKKREAHLELRLVMPKPILETVVRLWETPEKEQRAINEVLQQLQNPNIPEVKREELIRILKVSEKQRHAKEILLRAAVDKSRLKGLLESLLENGAEIRAVFDYRHGNDVYLSVPERLGEQVQMELLSQGIVVEEDELKQAFLDKTAEVMGVVGPRQELARALSKITLGANDTGLDEEHPSFPRRMAKFIPVVPQKGDPQGHGTHVASIMASRLVAPLRKLSHFVSKLVDASPSQPPTKGIPVNTSNLQGIASGARVVVTGVFGEEGAATGDILSGREVLVEQVDGINESLGGEGDMDDPLSVDANEKSKKTAFTVAAGNGGPLQTKGSPASGLDITSVGSANKGEGDGIIEPEFYTNRGPIHSPKYGFKHMGNSVTASGGSVWAAMKSQLSKVCQFFPGGIVAAKSKDLVENWAILCSTLDKNWVAMAGTSMASPVVAAIKALAQAKLLELKEKGKIAAGAFEYFLKHPEMVLQSLVLASAVTMMTPQEIQGMGYPFAEFVVRQTENMFTRPHKDPLSYSAVARRIEIREAGKRPFIQAQKAVDVRLRSMLDEAVDNYLREELMAKVREGIKEQGLPVKGKKQMESLFEMLRQKPEVQELYRTTRTTVQKNTFLKFARDGRLGEFKIEQPELIRMLYPFAHLSEEQMEELKTLWKSEFEKTGRQPISQERMDHLQKELLGLQSSLDLAKRLEEIQGQTAALKKSFADAKAVLKEEYGKGPGHKRSPKKIRQLAGDVVQKQRLYSEIKHLEKQATQARQNQADIEKRISRIQTGLLQVQASPNIVQLLVESVKNDPFWLNRWEAAVWLWNMGASESVEALKQTATADQPVLREMAIKALWSVQTDAAKKALEELFENLKWDVQLYSAVGLAKRGDYRGISKLNEFVQDFSAPAAKFKRFSAIWGLGEVRKFESAAMGKEATQILAQNLFLTQPSEGGKERELNGHEVLATLTRIALSDPESLSDEAVMVPLRVSGDKQRLYARTAVSLYAVMAKNQNMIAHARETEAIRKTMEQYIQENKQFAGDPTDPVGATVRLLARILGIRLEMPVPVGEEDPFRMEEFRPVGQWAFGS
ncbi:MAG: S8 family serine peptidase, partial [Elusimicrobia bacterium]|nr:S8 family serine peptidase [Elusimicrobiota bacterium]